MQNQNHNGETPQGGQSGRRVALAIKIALGQAGMSPGVISEDDESQALFDLGFEVGGSGMMQGLTLMQGVLAGIENAMDIAANDNGQGELQLVRD